MDLSVSPCQQRCSAGASVRSPFALEACYLVALSGLCHVRITLCVTGCIPPVHPHSPGSPPLIALGEGPEGSGNNGRLLEKTQGPGGPRAARGHSCALTSGEVFLRFECEHLFHYIPEKYLNVYLLGDLMQKDCELLNKHLQSHY